MSESSLDGSLNSSFNYETWASTSTPGEEPDLSPIKAKKIIPVDEECSESTASQKDESKQDLSHDMSIKSTVSPLHYVNKLSDYLTQRGFSILHLQESDISLESKEIPIELVNTWASSVLNAVGELSDRLHSQRAAMSSASVEARTQSASKEALLSRISDLQVLVLDHEKKEKILKEKLFDKEKVKSEGSKGEKGSEQEQQKKLKYLELRVQELQRKLRQREGEYDKLRGRLSAHLQKEREESAELRGTLQALLSCSDPSLLLQSLGREAGGKAGREGGSRAGGKGGGEGGKGETSFLSTDSLTSRGGGEGGRGRRSREESLSKVVEALLRQRREMEREKKEGERERGELLREIGEMKKREGEGRVLGERKEGRGEERGQGEEGVVSLSRREYEELGEREREHREELSSLQRSLSSLSLNFNLLSEQHSSLQSDYSSLKRAYLSCQEELKNAPSRKDFREMEQAYLSLQVKLTSYLNYTSHARALGVAGAGGVGGKKQFLDNKQLMERDKQFFHLQLYLLDSLSKEVLLEIVKDLCATLSLSSVGELLPCVVRLKQAVGCIPYLERQVVYVASYLKEREEIRKERERERRGEGRGERGLGGMGERGGRGEEYGTEESMEEVQRILNRWWQVVQQSAELSSFRERVLLELYRGQLLLENRERGQGGETHKQDDRVLLSRWLSEGRALWLPKPPSSILSLVRELVDLQAEALLFSPLSSRSLTSYLHTRPDLLASRLLLRLASLLDARPEEVVQEVQRLVGEKGEMESFLESVRLSLGIGKGEREGKEGKRGQVYSEVIRIIEQFNFNKKMEGR